MFIARSCHGKVPSKWIWMFQVRQEPPKKDKEYIWCFHHDTHPVESTPSPQKHLNLRLIFSRHRLLFWAQNRYVDFHRRSKNSRTELTQYRAIFPESIRTPIKGSIWAEHIHAAVHILDSETKWPTAVPSVRWSKSKPVVWTWPGQTTISIA